MGVGEVAKTFGARHGDVEQTALLFHFAGEKPCLLSREEVVFHAGDEDGVEFQPFGGVNGHESDARRAVVLLIAVGLQGALLQKLCEQHGVGGHLCFVFGFLIAAVAFEGTDGTEQFFHVLPFAFAFRAVFFVEIGANARGIDDVEGQVEGTDIVQARAKFEDEVAKRLKFAERSFGELHAVLRRLFGHRPQTNIVFARSCENLLQRGGTDAASGVVHHALEGFFVVEIGDETEVGNDVLDFFALIERHAAVDAVRHVVFAQRILERAALCVGAVEYGDFVIGHLLTTVQPTDRANHFCGLFLVGRGGHHQDLIAESVLAVHRFLDLLLVVTDDAVGRPHNVLCGAIVLFQLHRDRLRILAVELENVVDVGSAKGVDALCIVAHYADIMVVARELTHDGVLGIVGVLVLVYQDEAKTLGIAAAGFLDTIEEQVGVEQQIVEIEGFGRAASAEVFGVDAMNFAEIVAAVAFQRLRIGGIFLGQDEAIFRFRNAPRHARRFVGLVVEF